MGHTQTARAYRPAVKHFKDLSTRDDHVQGQPYNEQDKYYPPINLHDHRVYEEADRKSERITKAASKASALAPMMKNKTAFDPDMSRVVGELQRWEGKATIK